MSEIKPADRYQYGIFSCLEDQIEESSIVKIIDKIVDKIYENEKNGTIETTEVGRPEYPRKSLVKLYTYGYMNRIKSSRKLERECKVNVEVMWLMGRLTPDHWTISNFRKDNQEEIKHIIKRFNKFLMDSGYLEGKTIVIDGTKLKANASSNGNMNIEEIKERVKQTEEKITYYLEAINQTDTDEDEIEQLRKEKEELIKQKEELLRQVEYLKTEKKKVYVKTDPESNIIKTKEGSQAAYNVQISCDAKHGLLVAGDVNSRANDFEQLENMYEQSKEHLVNKEPEEIIADAGYYSPEQIEEIEKDGKVKTYISPLPEQSKGKFNYDKENNQYVCENEKVLKFEKCKTDRNGRKVRSYRCYECQGCPKREQCTTSKKGRVKLRYENQEFRDSYRKEMEKEESKEKIKVRKKTVEHPFGTIKLWLGKNPILTRGIKKVKTEIRFALLAYNVLRLYNIEKFDKLMEKIEKYQWQVA